MSITISLQWRHNLKSPAYELFAQSSAQVHIKENTKATRYLPLWGESNCDGESLHKGPVTRKMFPIDDVII